MQSILVVFNKHNTGRVSSCWFIIQGVPLATESGISLIILPLIKILQRNLKRTTDTHYRHTLQTHSFSILTQRTYPCNIFIGVKLNSVALVRERTIPTERPPPVGKVSANFCGKMGVTWSAQRVPTAVSLCFLDGSRYFFYSSISSIDLTRLTRLSGPRSRPTTTQKIWQRRESNPGPLYLQPETLTTRPQKPKNMLFCANFKVGLFF